MTREDKKFPAGEGEISSLIASLIDEAAKEDVPPRLRALAQQLESALDRRDVDRSNPNN
ncbi:MAG: hypothetical protein ABI832_11425 [bacterium]